MKYADLETRYKANGGNNLMEFGTSLDCYFPRSFTTAIRDKMMSMPEGTFALFPSQWRQDRCLRVVSRIENGLKFDYIGFEEFPFSEGRPFSYQAIKSLGEYLDQFDPARALINTYLPSNGKNQLSASHLSFYRAEPSPVFNTIRSSQPIAATETRREQAERLGIDPLVEEQFIEKINEELTETLEVRSNRYAYDTKELELLLYKYIPKIYIGMIKTANGYHPLTQEDISFSTEKKAVLIKLRTFYLRYAGPSVQPVTASLPVEAFLSIANGERKPVYPNPIRRMLENIAKKGQQEAEKRIAMAEKEEQTSAKRKRKEEDRKAKDEEKASRPKLGFYHCKKKDSLKSKQVGETVYSLAKIGSQQKFEENAIVIPSENEKATL